MTMEHLNERELLAAAMQGSQIAYRELISLHQGTVYRFAWALIGEEHAQEVTENAFITTWRQLDYLKSLHMSFQERLLQLVCIDCSAIAKRQRRHRVNMPGAQDTDALNFPFSPMRYDPRSNMEHIALQSDIEEAIHSLPFHFRQILLLHEIGNLADTQIADITGDSAHTVHTDLIRACGFVRRQIILGGGFFPLEERETAGKRDRSAPQYRACQTYLPTLAAAADDLCTNAEKQILLAHFAKCPGCQGYYNSLRAIHHGIAVMKHDAPSDMAAYIIRRIQQEDGAPTADAKKSTAQRRRFRPAFGRFTIIALCIALLLLAYSNGIAERFGLPGAAPQQEQQQTLEPDTPENEPAVAPETESSAPPENDSNDSQEVPPSSQEDPSQEPDTETEDDAASDSNGSSVVPGGSTSSTLIPEGEHYTAIYTVDAAGSTLLSQFSSASFSATLSDGASAVYYVVPSSRSSELQTALEEATISYISYTGETSSLDESAENALYIILSTT